MEEIERPGDVTLSFDWFLRVLVGMANSSRLQVNVTLNVGGLLLSGTLISERQYFEGVAEGIRSATAPNMSEGAKEQVAEAFRQIPDLTSRRFADLSGETPEGAEPAEAERPEDQLSSQYVHLGDVQTISSTGERANLSGALWRGRLAAVDGFWLGSISDRSGHQGA